MEPRKIQVTNVIFTIQKMVPLRIKNHPTMLPELLLYSANLTDQIIFESVGLVKYPNFEASERKKTSDFSAVYPVYTVIISLLI